MDSQVTHGTDEDKPVSPNENPHVSEHTDRTPLSTDSMVTVRLSETIFLPNADVSPGDRLLEGPDFVDLPESEGKGSLTQEDDIAIDTEQDDIFLEDALKQMPRAGRESTTSLTSIGENKRPDSMLTTFRSRSNSSGTFSSSDSAHVDWDELDKSEEQAPRDEGSDEVYFTQMYTKNFHSDSAHRQLHFFLQGLSKKIMLLQQIQRQQLPGPREAEPNLGLLLFSTSRSS